MTAIFDLPSINGAFEIGIAVGVDPVLPDNHNKPSLADTKFHVLLDMLMPGRPAILVAIHLKYAISMPALQQA